MNDSNKNFSKNNEEITESVETAEAADTAASIISTESDEMEPNIEDIEFIQLDENNDTSFSEETIPPSSSHKKKPRNSKILSSVILVIAIGVFLFAVINIGLIISRYIKESNHNDNIEDLIIIEEINSSTTEITVDGINYPNISPSLNIDFDSLKSINENGIGWVSVPTVDIEYPIVQGSDNDFYLDHSFDNSFAWTGAIFLDYRNSMDLTDPHSFIYGHHMHDGTMFADLLKYESEDFFIENQGYNYFYVYLEDHINVYEICAVCDVTFTDNQYAFRIGTNDSFSTTDYMDYIHSIELYDTGVEVDDDDTIVTLFTCQGDSSSKVRHMIHGKLITELDY